MRQVGGNDYCQQRCLGRLSRQKEKYRYEAYSFKPLKWGKLRSVVTEVGEKKKLPQEITDIIYAKSIVAEAKDLMESSASYEAGFQELREDLDYEIELQEQRLANMKAIYESLEDVGSDYGELAIEADAVVKQFEEKAKVK